MSHRDASASVGNMHEHAIEHPIRVRILTALGEQRLLSPLDLSSELQLPLRRVTYHFRRLQLLGVIELARMTPRAGGDEHHYRLAPDAAAQALVRRVMDGIAPTPLRVAEARHRGF